MTTRVYFRGDVAAYHRLLVHRWVHRRRARAKPPITYDLEYITTFLRLP